MGTRAYNAQVATQFDAMADLLEDHDANIFRINAYRRAAQTLRELELDLRDLVKMGGAQQLQQLPTIGVGIAGAIVEIVNTGRWTRLERLRGELDPVLVFQTIPGVGATLAERIHDVLHIDSLEALRPLVASGKLRDVPGIGPRREAAIRAAFATPPRRLEHAKVHPTVHPPIPLLLDIDTQYRQRSAKGSLPRLSPKKFNPHHKAWLPVMHTQRDDWHFTALFSNTERAHALNRTSDWVVIYFYDGDHREGQCTVVTETRGPLRGMRVIRGYEPACARFYERTVPAAGRESA